MIDKALVSIVIPVYNAENYLRECVDSIISQDYKNIEVILIDDGSTDTSSQICDEYDKKYNRINVIHKKNEGVSTARNVGIEESNGKWITFVDADDWIEKDYVSYLYKNGEQNNSEISLTTFPNKVSQENKKYNKLTIDNIQLLSGKDAAKMMLYYKIVISSWNKMFNRNFLRRNNIKFDETMSYGEGFDFVINSMIHANNVCVGRKKIYNYRVDNVNSAMTVFKEKLVIGSIDSQDNIRVRIRQYFKENKKYLCELLYAWEYSNWHTHCDCLNTIYGSKSYKKYKELTKRISKVCRRNAKYAFNKEVPKKDRLKAILYFISPHYCSLIINKVRMRKFNTDIKD